MGVPTNTRTHSNRVWLALKQAFFDLFVVAHFLGSLVKTLILRDWKLALALLLVWEVMEYSFQHLLPNFAECWWDHWILGTVRLRIGCFTM